MFDGNPARKVRILTGLIIIFLGLVALEGGVPPWTTLISAFLIGFGIYAMFRKAAVEQTTQLADPTPAKPVLQGVNDMVQVGHGLEIDIAYGLLKSAGIPVTRHSSYSSAGSQNWAHQESGGVLWVPTEWLSKAQEVLDSRVSDRELEEAAEKSRLPEDYRPGER